MNRDEALARTDLADLLERIGADRGLSARHHQYPCPADDHQQSGNTPPVTISRDAAGYDVWKCHNGACDKGGTAIDALLLSGRARDIGDALEQLGVTREEPRPSARPRMVSEYTYEDAEGNPLFQVCRMEPKSFRQRRWENGAWVWGMQGVQRQLYHLPDVLAAKARGDYIFLTEGEKDAENVRAAGQTATTMPGGAGKWEPQYTETLTGAKVVILADDDEPGRTHAVMVHQRLFGRAATVGIRLPADGHKDISEHLGAGLSLNGSLRKAQHLLADPPPQTAASGARAAHAVTAAMFSARPRRDDLMVLGPLIQRGMRTVIGAQTGEGKTTLALQAVSKLVDDSRPAFLEDSWRASRQGCRALIVDLEQGEETLKARLLESGLAESERVDVLWEPSGIALDAREEDRAMVYDVLRDGHYDLVLLDPLYQLHLGSGNDEQVAAETMRIVDGWAREFNAAFLIPMHARKPHPQAGKAFTIHDIAGVGTWLRNAEFVMGLQLMNTGVSRLWFFKDRIGLGPEIRSHWFLGFDREEGFKRSHLEDRNRIAHALSELLARDEGATREELIAAGADAETDAAANSLARLLRRQNVYPNGDRYRSRPWEEQTSLMDAT